MQLHKSAWRTISLIRSLILPVIQDAAWMVAGQPLRCQTPEDVYLLLKSSDFISYDIEHAYDECQGLELLSQQTSTSYYLVLKKWFSMPRSHEFRCFVKGRSLIGKASPCKALVSYSPLFLSYKSTGHQLLRFSARTFATESILKLDLPLFQGECAKSIFGVGPYVSEYIRLVKPNAA